jgi:hypothetical protein
MSNIYIYIHVCCINNWSDIFRKLISDLKESGLYQIVKSIKCNILTQNMDELDECLTDPKIEIIGISNELHLHETPTINLLYEHSLKEDFKVLYIHTKGVTRYGCQNVTSWVKYLSYFNIYKHEICIDNLDTYDSVGVNLQNNPVLHYSGNFWWSKSEHIKKLGECVYNRPCSPEFWLTETQIGNHVSLWESKINHYIDIYNEDMYINKPITLYLYNYNT